MFENESLFKEKFGIWLDKRNIYLNQKSNYNNRTWYTHRRLRQARKHIMNALPNMFTYKTNAKIDRNTNKLE